MKALESTLIRLRAGLRARLARHGGAAFPSRLLIRLDDLDAPSSDPGSRDLPQAEVHRFIVSNVMWAGALPVHVVGRAQNPRVADTIRFAWRLECPVRVRTDTRGLAELAELWVDSGAREIRLRVAALGAGQAEVCGDTADEVEAGLAALLRARAARRAEYPRLVVEVPVNPRTADEIPAIMRIMRERGADAVELALPFRGPAITPQQVVLLDVGAVDRPPFHQTPAAVMAALRADGERPPAAGLDPEPGQDRAGGPDARGHCPIGTLQLELTARGALRSCPFHAEDVPWTGDVAAAWSQLGPHRARIRACGRRCLHPDLAA